MSALGPTCEELTVSKYCSLKTDSDAKRQEQSLIGRKTRDAFVAAMLVFVLAASAVPMPAVAQRIDITATQNRYKDLYAQGNFAAALVEAQKLEAAVRGLVGTRNPNYAVVLEFVGNSYQGLGKYADAENAFKRVLAIREALFGATSTQVADTLNNLANNSLKQGRYPDAEDNYKQAVAIYEQAKGPNSPDVAFFLNNMSVVYEAQGKYGEAETIRKRVLAIREQALGPNHPDVADTVSKLGVLYETLGRYAEAEALFRRALAIQDRLGADQLAVARTLNNLAILHDSMGKYGDAEAGFKRAVAIEEQILGPSHPVVAEAMQNLASVYKSQCRYGEAEGLDKRVIAIREQVLGPRHPDLAATLINLGNIYQAEEKYADGESLYHRALAIQEQALGKDHPQVAYTLHNLGFASEAQHRYDEAEAFYTRAVTIREQALGKDHPDVASTLNNLGNVLQAEKKYDEANAAYTRALAIYAQTVGSDHPDAALTAYNLSRLEAARGNTKTALDWSRKATNSLIAAAATAVATDTQGGQGCLVEQRSAFFTLGVANIAAAGRAGIEPMPALTREAFAMAQWANHSAAASALQQMGARFAAGTDALAALVRENQDLIALARDRDKALIAAMSKPERQQDRAAIAQTRKDIADAQSKLAALAARLEKEFPNYAALTGLKPLAAEEVQRLLGPDEVLAFWIAGEKETELFALTREGIEWHTIAIGSDTLTQKVAAFRRGLDVDAVMASIKTGKPDLFDLTLAHELYVDLLGPIEALLKRKHNLLVVPSGALTALPFHLLLTEVPTASNTNDFSAYRNAAWLINRNAVSVVPSVASLKALRVFARNGQAAKPMVGFGDPVFQSDPTVPDVHRSVNANTRTNPTAHSVVKTRAYTDFWRGASVDRAQLGEALAQLPDTADEIKDVAAKVGASASDIYLGKAASETALKAAPLAAYRIVYFATHGLVAGDVKGLAEPSLALTLPKDPTPLDDGLLTASEVAQLKLSADWVVLSACNTAAGDKPGAEALSGLARAFFYAGAHALLVSHWAVASSAATILTTSTFANIKSDPKLGRAEALRRAMVAYLTDTSNPLNAYPAFWGPFSIIGEGTVP